MQRLTARIEGRVQGVGFRMFAQREARLLRLTGRVRNTNEGDVEVVAEGPEPVLRDYLSSLHRGPSGSRVDRIESAWLPATGEFFGFQISV